MRRALAAVLWRPVRALLLGLAAAVIFIEEWGWRPLTAMVARLAQWPPLARLEARIAALPPHWALVMFLVPAVLLFPVKLLALWFIQQGRTALGVGVIVAAKLLGTALVGRLFILTEAQLVQYTWFARALGLWRATKERVHAALARSRTVRAARAIARAGRRWLRRLAGRADAG